MTCASVSTSPQKILFFWRNKHHCAPIKKPKQNMISHHNQSQLRNQQVSNESWKLWVLTLGIGWETKLQALGANKKQPNTSCPRMWCPIMLPPQHIKISGWRFQLNGCVPVTRFNKTDLQEDASYSTEQLYSLLGLILDDGVVGLHSQNIVLWNRFKEKKGQ